MEDNIFLSLEIEKNECARQALFYLRKVFPRAGLSIGNLNSETTILKSGLISRIELAAIILAYNAFVAGWNRPELYSEAKNFW